MDNLEKYLIGRGLFVFSDPGGAKPILALVESLRHKLEDYKLVSDRYYSFFKEFQVRIDKPSGFIEQEIEELNPNFIFTGTSYTSKIELLYIEQGIRKGINTYSFVDHWTNIRERFNNEGTEVFPSKICLIDSRAKNIAIEQGIDVGRLLVTGNPFQDYLKNWRPTTSKEQFFKNCGINMLGRRVIVFAPDPLSNVDGRTRFGFDEIQVSKELNGLLQEILKRHIFIFKPHPNQDLTKIDMEFLKNVIVADQGIDNNSLIFHSDYIIGFFSSYLIEADIMRKRVIRYLPEGYINDPFEHVNIGTVLNKHNLLQILNN